MNRLVIAIVISAVVVAGSATPDNDEDVQALNVAASMAVAGSPRRQGLPSTPSAPSNHGIAQYPTAPSSYGSHGGTLTYKSAHQSGVSSASPSSNLYSSSYETPYGQSVNSHTSSSTVDRHSYPSSYGTPYAQPTNSYGSFSTVGTYGISKPIAKGIKSEKNWFKKILKKGLGSEPNYYPTSSAYVSSYTPNYGLRYPRPSFYASSYGTHGAGYGSPYANNINSGLGYGFGGYAGFVPVRPAVIGSSFASFYGHFLGNGYGLGYPIQRPVPTLLGAFDHYRGPIYRGGFRPTLGPYGGQPYSELLSVTNSYGQPLLPYSPLSYGLLAKKSS